MTDLTVRTLNALAKSISQDTVAALRGKLRGVVALPGEDGYDAARTIWNAMIDRRPGADRPLRGAADVARAVDVRARATSCSLAVRGGGHNIAGNARLRGRPRDRPLADESGQRRSRDADAPGSSRAPRSPTSTRRRRPTGSRTPLGINSTTGVAGLTLGGGFGWSEPQVRADRRQSDFGGRGARPTAGWSAPARRRTRISSGHCAAAAATSASSPRSSSSSIRSARRCCRTGRLSACAGAERPAALPRLRRRGAGRAHVLGGDAQGAAAAVPARGMARQRSSWCWRCATAATSRRANRRRQPCGIRQADRRRRRRRIRSPPGNRHSIRCSRPARATTGSPTTSPSSATGRSTC